MKKLFPFYFIIALMLMTYNISNASTKNLGVPQEVKIVSQSCNQEDIYLTVIDLSNNEIVILCYWYGSLNFKTDFHLLAIKRTGMFVIPDTQNSIQGQDAPFPKKEEE